jgi:hypothetical protein
MVSQIGYPYWRDGNGNLTRKSRAAVRHGSTTSPVTWAVIQA